MSESGPNYVNVVLWLLLPGAVSAASICAVRRVYMQSGGLRVYIAYIFSGRFINLKRLLLQGGC